jgi:predicted Zn-ribbon and HTH transcriptional regulator
MPDEKDRFGDKLKDAERGREDSYFAQRDRLLLEKMRGAKASQKGEHEKAAAQKSCPNCGENLRQRIIQKVSVDECPRCKGMWIDASEFEELAKKENEGWFGRVLRAQLS